MEKLCFKIDKYSLSNYLDNLIKYLNENEIEHIIKNDIIEFSIYINNKKILCEGTIYKNMISNYTLYSRCNEDESMMLKGLISNNYPKKFLQDDDNVSYYCSFSKNNYLFNITLSNDINFNLLVNFLDDKNKPIKDGHKSNDRLEILFTIISAIIGLGLTILFIYLYKNKNNLYLNIINTIISYLYMQIFLSIEMKNFINDKFKSYLWSLLIPIIYGLIVFVFLLFIIVFNNINADSSLVLNCLMWSIYSMPSFLLVIGLIMLVLIGS